MKLNCGLSAEAKEELRIKNRLAELDLHIAAGGYSERRVFALFPVRVGESDCRWLEWVIEREHVKSSVTKRREELLDDEANGYNRSTKMQEVRLNIESGALSCNWYNKPTYHAIEE